MTPVRVGYVLKRYPRYSETFVVNEILAHEAAGVALEIFSLRPPNDGHFQDAIARVRAPLTYVPFEGLRAGDLWSAMQDAGDLLPGVWAGLESARGEDARDLYQAVRLARLVRERELAHLHAHFATVATTVARLAAAMAGVPYSFTAHAKDIFHEEVRPYDLRRKLRAAAGVITVSDFNLAYLRTIYGPDAARVRRIYNGLALEGFPFQPSGDRPARIVAVGRLIEKKGFGDLIAACGLLAADGQPVECRIIGTGPLEPELRARVHRLGLERSVRLLGPRPQREVIAEVQAAAVFAAPCVVGADGNRDGLPTTLLEAMALGTPAISTGVTGIPEVLRDGETGLMVPEHDPPTLARALHRLLWDTALRVQLATRARRLIERHFDIHRNTAQMRELFAAAPQEAISTPRSAVLTAWPAEAAL